MSVEICKYNRDRDNAYAEVIMNEVISSQWIYEKYLRPAIKELRIIYFRDNGEIRKCNLEIVMRALELLIEWVEGEDLEYLKFKLQNVQKFIPEVLQEDDILYIF